MKEEDLKRISNSELLELYTTIEDFLANLETLKTKADVKDEK